ncbi:MAG TPA: FecR domain-containing protein [Steroidobacter sp.]
MQDRREESVRIASEQAAEWFIRLKDKQMSRQDQRAYMAWLKRSPQNIAEQLRMLALYRLLRRVGIRDTRPASEAQSNVVDLGDGLESIPEYIRESGRPPPERTPFGDPSRWRFAAAVLVAAVLLALGGLMYKGIWLDRTVRTEPGEWRTYTLSDGSKLIVAPRTHLYIAFGDTQRVVDVEEGQAVFDVAKDARRPFYVRTERAVVRAVGTAFGVSDFGDQVVVTVAEGIVEVISDDSDGVDDGRQNRRLSAGEQVAVPESGPSSVRRVDVKRELAWAQKRFIFDNATIAEAAAAFNRLNRTQIVLDDPAIAARVVTGTFNAADPQAFARQAATILQQESIPVRLVYHPPGTLRLEMFDSSSRMAERDPESRR